jgi:glyoxylase-like metal-dependent hydrolase (beta-lactamase superfamily II)
MNKDNFSPGWILLGQYPIGDPDGVGSWILHHEGCAALLELPPDDQLVTDAAEMVKRLRLEIKFIMISHDHEDHFDPAVLEKVSNHPAFRDAVWITLQPGSMKMECLDLAGEPLWRIYAPKHSPTDAVTVFRGVAMTGDIELGQVRSVNREVRASVKRESLAYLASFEEVAGYRIHSLVSAHLNDVRRQIDWRDAIMGNVERDNK